MNPALMDPPVLETRGLNKAFGALEVARDINFTLQRGARHALIGPNGAGKTTLINLITGVLQPTSGTIWLEGGDVTALSQTERTRSGLARTFQINQLFRGLSVFDNVCLAVAERCGAGNSLLRPLGRQRHITDEAIELLDTLQLTDVARVPINELAYGRQRLVEIVIALAQRPQVLLLDEPAAGVPSSESQLILDVIDALSEDISVLIIEHDMELVFRLAKRITVLVSGTILTEGTPQEVSTDPRVRTAYLGSTLDG
ncbi:MAG: ABC transporter ATP-binding protein [Gammaproteobacteria bacterium]|nr:ABC transporter ATP-binding protein [Gammaproteobacteria bacterium]